MIKESEINPKGYTLTEEQSKNLPILLERINKVRAKWAKPMRVTSGVRSMEDHLRIYKQKNVPVEKIPMGSNHLKGAALDIADPDLSLGKWVRENEAFLEEVGLWMENPDFTKGWIHFQIFQYGSYKPGGSRFFKP